MHAQRRRITGPDTVVRLAPLKWNRDLDAAATMLNNLSIISPNSQGDGAKGTDPKAAAVTTGCSHDRLAATG
jgi:hypothetical protein